MLSFLIKLRPATLLKKTLWHRCFPVNFAKFLKHLCYRTPSGDCFCRWQFSFLLITAQKPSNICKIFPSFCFWFVASIWRFVCFLPSTCISKTTVQITEAYLRSCQTSKMKVFAKAGNGFLAVNYFFCKMFHLLCLTWFCLHLESTLLFY